MKGCPARWLWTSVLCAWLLLDPTARAQLAGSVDPTFGASLGLAGSVGQVLVQTDGKILVVGNFKKGIVRLNADGSQDTGFAPSLRVNDGPYNSVYASALQPDGKIVIGGTFTSVNGTARYRIARLNADGSLDTGFDPGAGPNGSVNALAIQADGKIIISGSFTSVGGVARTYLARLNANGSLDTGFDPGTGPNDGISAFAVQPDGKTVIGGFFTSVNGVARPNVARLNADGSVDTGFDLGAAAIGAVYALAVQTDGKVVIGGAFDHVAGIQRQGITRLNADGSLDTGFDPGTGANGTVEALAVQSDGKIIIGGYFNGVSGMTRNRVARLKVDGGLDATFDPGAGADSEVVALAVQSDGKIIIGGFFGSVDGTVSNGIARLYVDGSLDHTFTADITAGPNHDVHAMAVQADGKIVIGGIFTGIGGVSRNRVARLKADGGLDTTFDPDVGADNDVRTLAVQADGKIVIGGRFSSMSGVLRYYLARLNADGSLDTGFNSNGRLMGGPVESLAVQADGKIVIGGIFTSVGGVTRNRVARLNADGSLDTTFDPGAGVYDYYVESLAVQTDGKVVIGGYFSQVGGASHSGIARLNANGSLDTDFDPGAGTDSYGVNTVAVQADGKVLLGGAFYTVDGVSRHGIARFNANGSLDTTFNSNLLIDRDGVYALAAQADGKIVIGGYFLRVDGVARNNLARLNADGSLDTGFDPGVGADSYVYALAAQANGRVLLGGAFTGVNGVVRNYVARINGDGSVDPNFVPGDGIATINALALQSDDGKVVVGGDFSSAGGVPINALARLGTDGNLDASFAPGFASGDTVQAVALQPDDGDVLAAALVPDSAIPAASAHTTPSSIRPHTQTKIKNPIIRCNHLNGAFDADFTCSTDGVTLAVIGLSGRLTLLAGSFANVNGQAHANLARLMNNGSLDTSFVGVADATVRGVSVLNANGTIIVGGDFTHVNSVARNHVARLFANGSLDTSFDPGAGPNGSVSTVRALANGQTLIGGSFTAVGGVARRGIARLNANGTLDASYVSNATASAVSTAVTSLDVQATDGKVVIGGLFNQIDSAARPNVARLNTNGSVDTAFDPGSGTNAIVNALQLQPDGRTLLGGGFTNVGGLERRGAARLLGDNDVPLAPPVINSVGSASGKVGEAFSYQITATNAPTSYGVLGLPPGIRANGKSGLVSGTPTKAGAFTLTLRAVNGGGTNEKSLRLTVAPSAPVVTSAGTASGKVGTAFSYQITATNNPTGYGVVGLPPGLHVDGKSGLVSGTPTKAGAFTLTLKTVNGGGTGEKTLSLTILDVPVVTSVGTASARIGKAFSYQITATNGPTSFLVANNQPGFVLNRGTGLLTGTPKGPARTVTLTLKATNSVGTGEKTFTLTITN